MHIGKIIIFGEILEGVWTINNQKKCLLCKFRYLRKSGTTKLIKYLNYSIYKPSQAEEVALRVTHHCII